MIGALISLVIYLIVVGLILWLLQYLADNVLPEPFRRVARVVIMVLGVLILILLLLQFAGIMDVGVRPLVR